jgi:translation initiation factor 5
LLWAWGRALHAQFEPGAGAKELNKPSNLFQFCHENIKAQRYLLGGFELLIGKVHKDALLPKVPHIIKAMYDLEILEEEVILEWGEKVRTVTS